MARIVWIYNETTEDQKGGFCMHGAWPKTTHPSTKCPSSGCQVLFWCVVGCLWCSAKVRFQFFFWSMVILECLPWVLYYRFLLILVVTGRWSGVITTVKYWGHNIVMRIIEISGICNKMSFFLIHFCFDMIPTPLFTWLKQIPEKPLTYEILINLRYNKWLLEMIWLN